MAAFFYRCTQCGKTYAQHREKCRICRAEVRLEKVSRVDYQFWNEVLESL